MELFALLVFIFTYALIISERIHRTVAAMMGASIVLLANIVPWERVPVFLDLDTILLLAGMMIIVNTTRMSGLFEYIAIRTSKMAKGEPIRVLLLFSIVTAIVSAFLDNVTTVLLLTPMLLYISRLMEINPLPFLLSEIFASNIGGTATLIGDPPNIMIGSAAGLSFNEFISNMGPIALLDLVVMIIIVYFAYREVLRVSEEKKERILRTLDSLDERAAIRDLALFRKSITTILVVITLFFVHDRLGVEPAVVALFGASLLLFWSRENPEGILEKVEWVTLFFFGGLFILVGSLVETGFIEQIARWVMSYMHGEGEAMLIIAWFSAFASAIIDNIPFTATMIPLIKAMGTSLDTYPLWWALSLGACLGGNGTAIGASANVVVIGIAAKEGIKITFVDFLKMGIIVMTLTVGVGIGVLWFRYVWW
ncbi:transporter [Thermococcus sp. MV5]|uniref:SLC13 family permease n=1 Tax=Thermococcus sp. MV5 TaxID=1638272 RepID=UPI00143A3E11|nr:ArsB/NhaD family transporter [Thermococcus sp. MV5]NJE25721.1 transporter [Thermococcus sp. MV5]